MKRLLLSLFCLMPIALFGFQDPQIGAGSSGNGYMDILKRAKDEVRADTAGNVVGIANLASYGRQNDTSSVRPIRESDVMFKVRLWSKINFNEKINANFISTQSDIIKLIYEGVQAYYDAGAPTAGDGLQLLLNEGAVIVPYNDKDVEGSVGYEKSKFVEKTPLTKAEFDKSLENQEFTRQNFDEGNNEATWTSKVRADSKYRDLLSNPTALREKAQELFLANQDSTFRANAYNPLSGAKMDQLLIEEDLLFDKNHSLPVWDIISVTVFSPSTSPSQEGLFKIEYAQLKKYIEKVYNESNAERAFWFNTGNPGNKSLSFADAIDKRLFNAYIVSVENVGNEDILGSFAQSDEYNALLFAEKIRLQLLERVHNLWEY